MLFSSVEWSEADWIHDFLRNRTAPILRFVNLSSLFRSWLALWPHARRYLFQPTVFVVPFKGAFIWPSPLHPLPSFLPSFIPSLTFLSTSFLLISHYPVSCKRRHCQPQVSSRSPNSGLSLCGRTFNAFRVAYYFTNCFDSMPDQFPDGVTAITFNRDHRKFSI